MVRDKGRLKQLKYGQFDLLWHTGNGGSRFPAQHQNAQLYQSHTTHVLRKQSEKIHSIGVLPQVQVHAGVTIQASITVCWHLTSNTVVLTQVSSLTFMLWWYVVYTMQTHAPKVKPEL